MKKSSFKTEQNAVIKRTLSLQQVIMNYMDLSNIQIKDLKVIPVSNKLVVENDHLIF